MLCKIENAVGEHTHNKKTDWTKVTRDVLKTEPKCAQDVPDMVEWFKQIGGGTSRAYIPLISAMFDKFVDTGR